MKASASVDCIHAKVAQAPQALSPLTPQEFALEEGLNRIVTYAFVSGQSGHLISLLRRTLIQAERRMRAGASGDSLQTCNPLDPTEAQREAQGLLRRCAAGLAHTKHATDTSMPLAVDKQLSLLEFAALARAREGVNLNDEDVEKIFKAFANESRTISAHEYLIVSLREAVAASSTSSGSGTKRREAALKKRTGFER